MEDRHVALVTGASRGIGARIARRLARAPALVLVSAPDLEACAQVAAEIRAGGGAAEALRLDVTDPASIRSALERAAELARGAGLPGSIDWLVNNAGVVHSGPLVEGDADATYERLFAVNLHGPRRLIEALAPAMKRRGYGRIVNIASSAGLRGYKYVSAYCASKHALVGYSRAAALDLAGSGVALSVVCPHYVDSPMTDRNVRAMVEKTGKSEAEIRAFLAAQNPGGRMVSPEEVAEAALELLQGEQNGRIVELDGSGARSIEELRR